MESTIVRILETAVMIVGPAGPMADKIAARFEQARIRALRAGHVAAACERLAVAMPQLVVVISDLDASERDALTDRVMAVGALVMHVDPALDDETLDELLDRGIEVAIERRSLRDDPVTHLADGWD